jgi:hypothetical protein
MLLKIPGAAIKVYLFTAIFFLFPLVVPDANGADKENCLM